jgi:DNA-binding Lrp family transcriptional regulator
MRFTTKRDILEKKSLDLIFKAGEEGILQTELWKKLNMSSREGSRICVRLKSWGLIKREKVLYDGRWTYRIKSTRKPPSIGSILGAPCITCAQANSMCARGNDISPENCEILEKWILTSQAGGEVAGEGQSQVDLGTKT